MTESEFIDAVYLLAWGDLDTYADEMSFKDTIQRLQTITEKSND